MKKNDTVEEIEFPKSKKETVWEYIKTIVAVIIIVSVLNRFIIINAVVPSESMENTIMTGERFFGGRFSYWFSDPERFDIVVFKYPDDERQLFIKRVIGLPGETVNIIEGKVYIDGEKIPLEDSFIKEPMLGSFGPYTVPEDSYFMLGDNRNHSKDSRYWSNPFVSKEQIVGKALVSYWPLSRIGFMK